MSTHENRFGTRYFDLTNHFDPTASLPPGTTVVEASAGTGKTYAIVGIAAKQLADGLPIGSLLLVTFSRAATAELRDRMRERLIELVAALDRAVAPGAVADSVTLHRPTDPLVAELTASDDTVLAARRSNLVAALSDFDASTIATTHTFFSRMLEALGFLGERESSFSLVDEVDELVDQAAMDLFLLGFARQQDRPDFAVADAVTIAKEAVRNPGVVLSPTSANLDEGRADDAVAARRVRFSAKVREIVDVRKRMARLRTYDDLQQILYQVVTDPEIGEDACRRIRETFQLVLVDEFQDTDPFQWAILERCFHGHRQLVLVGDPKQSIYAFRGAEVLSYLAAVAAADAQYALSTNWRSDGDLVDALDSIYGGTSLGHPDIAVHPVSAAQEGSRITGAAAVRVRWFTRTDFLSRSDRDGLAPVSDVRAEVIRDVAADVARTLAADITVAVSGETVPRSVHPGDIAILVNINSTIEPLQRALAEHGVGSVVGAGSSIFATMSAQYWLWVLRAIEKPSDTGRVSLAALTPLVGMTPSAVADDETRPLERLALDLADLAHTFDVSGFAALSQRLLDRYRVPSRALGFADGERLLTDLAQVATVCNRHVVEAGSGLAGLVEWLGERIAAPSRWRRSDEQTRRLDRDTQVVQIMTVHASKGLQFPIVYVPFGWDGSRRSKPTTFRFHDDAGTRHLDVGGLSATGARDRLARSVSEDAGEELRKLYVALTRAGSQVVVWWAPSRGTPESPLHRLLFGRAVGALGADTQEPETLPEKVRMPDDAACSVTLTALAEGPYSVSAEHVSVSRVPDDADATPEADVDAAPRWRPTAIEDDTALSAARFTAEIDQGWRRTSYSAIIAGAGHGSGRSAGAAATGSEPEGEAAGVVDEPANVDVEQAELAGDHSDARGEVAGAGSAGTASPMNGLPFGAAFGTLVHEILEYVDTAQPDIDTHVRELAVRAASRHALDLDPAVLATSMSAVLTTPIGFGDLWGVPPTDRLAELDFEIPLAGDAANAGARLRDIATLMRQHLPDEDLLLPYAQVLETLPGQRLRGFLTGSIDSVLRTPGGQFVIVDYKTNRLRPGDLTAEDFHTEAMATEMIAAHYPLQALLYSVALHRYLRWRLPDYRPAEHLGVVQYHFVRGMVGPHTPTGCGVFAWTVPAELVVELSDLLAGGTT